MVAKVRRISGIKKVGHAGTLDPEAEGLMIILVGKEFTRQAAKYSKLDKTYEFSIKLGQESITDDEEGKKTLISSRKPTKPEIGKVLADLTGEILQTPPAYSAIKVGGQRAYKLARRGENVKLAPRPVVINSLRILSYNYPVVDLQAEVSSGTYIRALARSIGDQLKVGAYCTQIKRTKIGNYSLADSQHLD